MGIETILFIGFLAVVYILWDIKSEINLRGSRLIDLSDVAGHLEKITDELEKITDELKSINDSSID